MSEVPLSGPESVRRDTRLLLVSNDAMRARRRPLAVLGYHLYQLVLSALVAWPVSRGLAAAFSGHPRGDGVLFDEGGWALLALQRPWDRVEPAVATLVLLLVVVGAVVGLLPLAGLLTSVSHATADMRAPRPRHVAPYLVVTFWPLFWLLALGTALELALLAAAFWAFGATRDAYVTHYGDVHADEIAVLAFTLVMLLLAVVSVLHDVARAAVVRFRRGWPHAVRAALSTFRGAPLRLFWSWTWRGLVSLGLVLLAASLAARSPARKEASAAFIVLVCLHQIVALSRSALRASWLARALRAVDTYKAR